MAPTIVVEKDGLLPSVMPYTTSPRGGLSGLRATVYLAIALTCTCTALWSLDAPLLASDYLKSTGSGDVVAADLCPQAPAVNPVKHADLWKSLDETYGTETFASRATEWLGGAIRVP